MKKIFIALALLAAIPAFAKWKHKEKSFEPIEVRDVHSIVGHYMGIEHEFEIDLRVDANGKVIGSLVRNGVGTAMRNLVIEGSDLRSDVVRATFGDRVLNGDHRFGMMLSWPTVEYDGNRFEHLFCRKQ